MVVLTPRPAFDPGDLAAEDIDALNRAAREGGYLDPSWLLGVVPTLLSWQQSKALVAELDQIMRLLRTLPREMYGDTRDAGLRLAELVGMDERELAGLERADVPPPHLDEAMFPARWDVMLTPDGPRVLEVNLGLALGGVPSDGLNAAYDALTPITPGGWPRSADAWWRALTGGTEPVGSFAFVDDDAYWEESPYDALSWTRFLGARAPGRVLAGPLSAVDLDGSPRLDDRPLSGVGELFSITELSRSASGASYLDAVAGRRMRPTVSLWCEVLSSKTCLALLHEYVASLPDAHPAASAVRRLVPQTHRLGEGIPPTHERDLFVLKPARAYGGAGIVVGTESAERQWQEEGEDLLRADPFAVAQERVHPISGTWPQMTVDREGIVRSTVCHPPVLGFYVVDSALVSAMSRAHGTGAPVISARSGASLSAVRFTDAGNRFA